MPPFGPTMKIFYRRLYMKRCVFAVYQQISEKNGRICGFHWTFKSSVSASGGPPSRGSAPGPRWGLRPQTPVIGSRSARSPCPPLPNPKYATDSRCVGGLSWEFFVYILVNIVSKCSSVSALLFVFVAFSYVNCGRFREPRFDENELCLFYLPQSLFYIDVCSLRSFLFMT